MEQLKLINLDYEQLESLPLFIKKIYYNQVTFIEDENKLFKYSSHFQTKIMRNHYASRMICKTLDFKKLKQNDTF